MVTLTRWTFGTKEVRRIGSFESCRNLSMREELWSGPAESNPCGRRSVNADGSAHFVSPEAK